MAQAISRQVSGLRGQAHGAWIAAAALAVVGGSLSAGAEVLGAMLRWAMPTALVLAGAIVAIRWKRGGQ